MSGGCFRSWTAEGQRLRAVAFRAGEVSARLRQRYLPERE